MLEKDGYEKIYVRMLDWFKKENHDCSSKNKKRRRRQILDLNALNRFRAGSDYFRFPPPIG
jgi:hypothetical protein